MGQLKKPLLVSRQGNWGYYWNELAIHWYISGIPSSVSPIGIEASRRLPAVVSDTDTGGVRTEEDEVGAWIEIWSFRLFNPSVSNTRSVSRFSEREKSADILVALVRWTALLRHPPPVSPETLHRGAEVGGVAPDGTLTARLLGGSEAPKE